MSTFTNSASTNGKKSQIRVLVIDVGEDFVKVFAPGSKKALRFPSGPGMTARRMCEHVCELVKDCQYDAVTIGFPGPVIGGKPAEEPANLRRGWKRFNFQKAFGKPVKLINNAAMHALGSYRGGRMLFIGLGTGLESALILNGILLPLELGEIRYPRRIKFEDILREDGVKRLGHGRWEKGVYRAVENLKREFRTDYIVLGGSNARRLRKLPRDTWRGSNARAYEGGLRLWQDTLWSRS